MPDYKIITRDELTVLHKQELITGLNHHAFQKKGLGQDNGAFSFAIVGSNDAFIAGLQGYHYYGCCNIDLLYVKEDRRGNGYGSILMEKVEKIAQERECLFITVNTMDFEGKPFYEKHGYRVEFVREGFQQGSVMYYMRKTV